ncbi:hypothetical protein [Mycobacterium paraterrae]|uniref:PE-PGRS family protein n=1 Tax=Mycobacterium paraterrae TaxID=577492 RepID=A0ABY3VXK7_9MYCO|nr:hypothetical protein [Mycobacterium paraterrae]UMB71346.1 hypothetical protein MKK62_08910 [Mycobacterium paraterrae]
MHPAVPFPSTAAHAGRLMVAGLAVVGAGLFALDAPTGDSLVRHHDVKLVSGEVDWTTFLSNTEANLATLQTEATTSSTELSTALGNVSDAFSTQISTALTGFDTGINNALFGGWYGGDDGYVFGLFGGEPVLGGPTPGVTGSLLATLATDFQNISTNPNGSEQLFSDFNAYSLELLDHTLKPLLSPLLDETTKGVTTLSIPVELSQIQTNLLEAFGSYNELKDLAQTVLSPEISGFFALTADLDDINAAMTAGDSTLAMTDLNNLGSDVLNAVVNGYDAGVNPVNGVENIFPGLINAGSFLDELYTTWTTQFIDALGSLATESATAGASEAVTTAVPDLFTGLLSF